MLRQARPSIARDAPPTVAEPYPQQQAPPPQQQQASQQQVPVQVQQQHPSQQPHPSQQQHVSAAQQHHHHAAAAAAAAIQRPRDSPKWLKAAVSEFVHEVPALTYDDSKFDGGFSKWVDSCAYRDLWRPNCGWRKLLATCKDSGQVRGVQALSCVRQDIIALVVNSVYRSAEEEYRRRNPSTHKYNEANTAQKVAELINRQRHHELHSLTLSKLLDFSFMLTAYTDSVHDGAGDEATRSRRSERIESELNFLNATVSVEALTSFFMYMESAMQSCKWLPWYEEVPNIRNNIVIRAREAAQIFCQGIPMPVIHGPTGVRGLVQNSQHSPSGMDTWLLSLLEPKFLNKWEDFTAVYTTLSNSVAGEEEPLLEELSRRVVGTSLEPLIEHTDKVDHTQSILTEIVPEILNRQSVRQPGMLTFRMLLELHIYLSVFRSHLVDLFYLKDLPDISKIHMAVVLFGQLVDRIAEIRFMLRPEQNMVLMQWSMASIERPTPPPENVVNPIPNECLQYKKGAIGAVLGRVFIKFTIHWAPFEFGMHTQPTYDPLVYASVIAEWDPLLAAKIIDAAIQITPELRRDYEIGTGHGVTLYMYRRIVVCDAAKQRTSGDCKAAGAILAKLHPVWDVVNEDKKVGRISLAGLEFMRTAVERGNFEAATFYGLLISSPGWAAVRKELGLEQSIDSGIRLILQALENGDFSSSIDLANIITSVQSARPGRPYSKALVTEILNTMRDAAPYSPMVSLHLGYVYSAGGCGVQADCTMAMTCYEKVLAFSDVTAATRAHAINNLAILITISKKSAIPNDSRAPEYLVMASVAGNLKSKTNLAAMYCFGVSGIPQNLEAAESVYRDYFNSTKGRKPVCLMQKSGGPNMVHISQVLVDLNSQEHFLKTIGQGCAPLLPQNFGKVLYSENSKSVSRVL